MACGDPGLVLPDQFVLAGHSGGSLLAVETAGFFEQTAPTDERSNLVGVLLFDIGADGGILARSLANIPDDVPVYDIAAAPNVLDSYGGSYAVLAAARPGQFVGVQIVGGKHADSPKQQQQAGAVRRPTRRGWAIQCEEHAGRPGSCRRLDQ